MVQQRPNTPVESKNLSFINTYVFFWLRKIGQDVVVKHNVTTNYLLKSLLLSTHILFNPIVYLNNVIIVRTYKRIYTYAIMITPILFYSTIILILTKIL